MQALSLEKPILITGAAGFIGFHLAQALLQSGKRVIGFDNINSYYDVKLKEARLKQLAEFSHFTFIKGDLAEKADVDALFAQYQPEIAVNLAAQAGVRYSLENPYAYVQSNVTGFLNVLEACRNHPVGHLLYASSSSVYGANTKVPFSTDDKTDSPISLYAATKKSDELMAYTYSHLFGIPCTGLRFFTVYGPFGRPDMAYYSFAQKILAGKPITVYNHGDMYRDFTYIDDIIACVTRMLNAPPTASDTPPHRVYNIGNSRPEKLTDFISVLEDCLGKKALLEFAPMQPGDVYKTCADTSALERDFGFKPATPITEGLTRFASWYKEFYKLA
ncbi:NAD-dependent epimerase [Acetanaerobacterium elongatum]|uniref:UDP-glucuronate 4-epimerase n=1 Tax=Acetanaerobacterium elongatum TaxID=258515 RepID=A0A1G9Z5U2_9FIRM|nr:NAD-dependent epimerase [Acetanaerobacterium elongatum]SDN16161.1 UDP-glucuronate 4-epimerase [Acetanaerobacterium elongatum]